MARMSPMEMLNSIKEKAKLGDENFAKSIAIRLKPGKIKFQLIAMNSEHLFKPRVQHMLPTVPNEDDSNEKWMVCDCKGEGCPVCAAANAFKNSGVTLEEVNEAYNMKYPYKNLRAVFTQPEHYLLCARILGDDADEGSYLPKDSELGSTHLIQFNKTALNNLMSAYEDFMDDFIDSADEGEEVPPLFAIFDGEKTVKSLTITCRVSLKPYSCTFAFNKVVEANIDSVDKDKLELLEISPEVPEEHYENCVKRIKKIQNYFVNDSQIPFMKKEEDDVDLPFTTPSQKEEKKSVATDDDFDISDML